MIATESPAPTPALLESHWASSATRDAAASYERVSTTELASPCSSLPPPPPPPLLLGHTKAGCTPLPAATCRSRQLRATLSLPPTNQGGGGAADPVEPVVVGLESDCFECDDAGALRHSKPDAKLPKKAEGVATEEAWRRSNCARSLSALCCGGGGEEAAGGGGSGGGVPKSAGGRTAAAPGDEFFENFAAASRRTAASSGVSSTPPPSFQRRPTSNSRPAPPPPPELEFGGGGGGEALAAATTRAGRRCERWPRRRLDRGGGTRRSADALVLLLLLREVACGATKAASIGLVESIAKQHSGQDVFRRRKRRRGKVIG